MSDEQLVHRLDIDAPIDVVWSIMIDFADYGRWNPFVVEAQASGRPGMGSPLRLTARMPAGWRTRTRHRITAWSPPDGGAARLGYEVVGPLTLLVGGARMQTLESLSPTQTRYTSIEAFRGPMARFAPARQVEEGVIRHADGLKWAAEGVVRARRAESERSGARHVPQPQIIQLAAF